MKNLTKYVLALLAGVFVLTACSDDDSFTPGPATNADGLNVYFDSDKDIVLEATATSFEFTVSRNIDNGAITVPLRYEGENLDIFSLPSSVSFAEGELTKTLTVNCSEQIEMFKAYKIQAIIDDAYTTQYSANVTGFPRAILDIIKEDFKPFAEGTYTSAWTEMGEPATLEFSEIKKCYRFKKATSGLFTYEFSVGEKPIDDEESEMNGFYPISYSKDFEDLGSKTSEDWADPTYGIMTMFPGANESAYDAEHKTYYLSVEYTVSAGSFGSYYDTFEVQ